MKRRVTGVDFCKIIIPCGCQWPDLQPYGLFDCRRNIPEELKIHDHCRGDLFPLRQSHVGVFPTSPWVSWESHLFGFIVGVGPAYLYGKMRKVAADRTHFLIIQRIVFDHRINYYKVFFELHINLIIRVSLWGLPPIK